MRVKNNEHRLPSFKKTKEGGRGAGRRVGSHLPSQLPSYSRGKKSRIMVQVSMNKNMRPYLKNN
jgi:hypothetical protein